jgi:hypothetical protein
MLTIAIRVLPSEVTNPDSKVWGKQIGEESPWGWDGVIMIESKNKKIQARKNSSRQLGASIVEYTLLIGIVAGISIGAMRTIGEALAGTEDPCKPGFLVRVARDLGAPGAVSRKCEPPSKP